MKSIDKGKMRKEATKTREKFTKGNKKVKGEEYRRNERKAKSNICIKILGTRRRSNK